MQSRSLSKSEVVALALGVMVMAVLGTAALGQAGSRELSNRAVCAANLRGIGQSMAVYSADNSDMYPSLVPSSATTYDVGFKEEAGGKNADAAIESLYKQQKYPNNPTANLWLMVLTGQVAAKQFICKSDAAATDVSAMTTKDGQFLLNFSSPKSFSYSTAYPWAMASGTVVVGPLWRNYTDASLPLLSDMAPYLGKTAADMAVPAGDSAAEKWVVTRANSLNHDMDGQNVGFGDCHVEFCRNPAVGQGNDSMWGTRKSSDGPDRAERAIGAGTLPHALSGKMGEWDVVMVPTRDAKGELK